MELYMKKRGEFKDIKRFFAGHLLLILSGSLRFENDPQEPESNSTNSRQWDQLPAQSRSFNNLKWRPEGHNFLTVFGPRQRWLMNYGFLKAKFSTKYSCLAVDFFFADNIYIQWGDSVFNRFSLGYHGILAVAAENRKLLPKHIRGIN